MVVASSSMHMWPCGLVAFERSCKRLLKSQWLPVAMGMKTHLNRSREAGKGSTLLLCLLPDIIECCAFFQSPTLSLMSP